VKPEKKKKKKKNLSILFITINLMSMTNLWDREPCNLIEIDQHLRGAYCVHQQGDEPVKVAMQSQAQALIACTMKRWV
jgi:hypothetical protein